MNAWLMYCRLNKNVNPNPGPCRNECLLETNEDSTGWVAKEDLVMARKDKEGDYRRISKATWETFCELYPGSGPAIRLIFQEDEHHTHAIDGLYDTSTWMIDQSQFSAHTAPPPPVRKINPTTESSPPTNSSYGEEESKGADPMNSARIGSMDDPANPTTTDETTRSSFQQFFGTTGNPMVSGSQGYQPTSRSSESGKEKSEVCFLPSPPPPLLTLTLFLD
jgi:hypothetical protein